MNTKTKIEYDYDPAEFHGDLSPASCSCPCCGNRDIDWLWWEDDDSLTCGECRVNYEPR